MLRFRQDLVDYVMGAGKDGRLASSDLNKGGSHSLQASGIDDASRKDGRRLS